MGFQKVPKAYKNSIVEFLVGCYIKEQEIKEFLKVVRKSDYIVMDKLNNSNVIDVVKCVVLTFGSNN